MAAKAMTVRDAGPWSFWSLTWAHFLNDGLANYLPGVLPLMALERHVPIALIGSFMTALLLGQALQPLAGIWADHAGGRGLILGGIALSTASAALVGWAHPVWLILALLLLTGIGSTLFHPQALTAARALSRIREGTGMSVFLIGGEIGRGVGPIVATLVATALGLKNLWVLALPLLLTYWPVWHTTPRAPRRVGSAAAIRWRHHLKPAAAMVGFSAIRAGVIYTVVTLAPIIWHAHGGSLVSGAGLVTTLIGVGVVGNFAGGAISDRFGRWRVIWLSTLASCLLLVAFMAANAFWEWITLALLGISLFASTPITLLIGQDIFSENPALGSGVALGLANGLGAILVFPLTYLAAQSGSALAVLILAGLTLVSLSLIPPMRGQTLAKKRVAGAS